jgi:hypothetical protein
LSSFNARRGDAGSKDLNFFLCALATLRLCVDYIFEQISEKLVTTLLAQIAPQRSTQYADLATTLAPHELKLSSVGRIIKSIDVIALGGQTYCRCELAEEADKTQLRELGMLATTSAFFWHHEALGEHTGPFLKPIESGFDPYFPPEFVTTRRYKGKTNELFTHFLCNLAKFSSDFVDASWDTLRVFDPLSGGGTTLFTALMLGADVAGVEKNTKDVQSTASFIKQYVQAQKIACKVKEERLKKLGKRWWFSLDDASKQCVLTSGDTVKSAQLIAGFKKPHLIVTDLPYGIQHRGQLMDLLTEALPVWASLLTSGGAMALAWESTRFARNEMIALVESTGLLTVLNESPYDQLAHRVDRVIKLRDIVIVKSL